MASYENLDAHKKVDEFDAFLVVIMPRLNVCAPNLALHLRKSTDSMGLNICEAQDNQTPAKIANYYRIASGSCSECKGALHRAQRRGCITKEEAIRGRLILNAIAFFLHRLILYWENQ